MATTPSAFSMDGIMKITNAIVKNIFFSVFLLPIYLYCFSILPGLETARPGKMRRGIAKSILLFIFLSALPFMLLSCAGHIPGKVAPEKPLFSSGAELFLQAENIDDLAAQLAEKLDRVIDLDGKKIQISENNFLELDSRLNLLFSRYLSEALATAITRHGARVTVQEIGEEPLRLFGNFGKYTPGKNHLKVTIRLRKMGQFASEDIAVSGNISNTGVEKEWFEPDFSRVANTLINILEENYHGSEHHLSVSVEPLSPGRYGEKPLELGEFFREYIVTALSRSPLFRSAAISPEISPASLTGTYEKAGAQMRFLLTLTDSGGQETSAFFEVQQRDIPADLMEETFFEDETPTTGLDDNLWITIQPENRALLSGNDKQFLDKSSELINGFFTKHGYKISFDKQKAKLRIFQSLSIDRGENDYVEDLRLNLTIRALSTDLKTSVSTKNGRIGLKYSKTMSQFDKDNMIFDALPKLTNAVCESVASEINKRFKNK